MRKFRDLILVLLIAVLSAVGVFAASQVPLKQAGRFTLVPGTPQAIGNATGRVYLYIKNDDVTLPFYCGYIAASLSATPGPSSGAEFDAFRARSDFVFPDKIIYCLAAVSTMIGSYDEARIVTGTPTANATPTNTPT